MLVGVGAPYLWTPTPLAADGWKGGAQAGWAKGTRERGGLGAKIGMSVGTRHPFTRE
jgi:hypothetical protein